MLRDARRPWLPGLSGERCAYTVQQTGRVVMAASGTELCSLPELILRCMRLAGDATGRCNAKNALAHACSPFAGLAEVHTRLPSPPLLGAGKLMFLHTTILTRSVAALSEYAVHCTRP